MKTYTLDDFKIGDVVKLNTEGKELGEIVKIKKEIYAICVLIPEVGVISHNPRDVIQKYVKAE